MSHSTPKTEARDIQLPDKYSHDYPVEEGHDYLVRSIPTSIWKRARARAYQNDEALRTVIIRALENYAKA